MTIRPGEEWGRLQTPPTDTRWFESESLLCAHLTAGPSTSPIGLFAGDLFEVAGRPTTPIQLSVDLLEVSFTTTQGASYEAYPALSSVAMGRWWSTGAWTAVSNTGRIDDREWFNRAHPNDGRAELVELSAEMGLRQRAMTMRRVRRGLPYAHPQITSSSLTSWEWSGSPRSLFLDHSRVGKVSAVRISLRPDALHIFVGSPSTAP